MMSILAAGMDYVDLQFLDRPGIIATAVLQSASGVALIDPGPSTTRGTLEQALTQKGIALRDVRQLLLTHIHLDHAGATGSLLRANPDIEVFVHERGAPHLIDPRRLIASATRLYGDDLERLWGDVLPVPAARVHALAGGETITAGGRELRVAYTPGHASHHVSYFDPSGRVAFVGDTAGILLAWGSAPHPGSVACGDPSAPRRSLAGAPCALSGSTYVMPPTPPPDIDLDAWRSSADRILAWDPDTLFLTHFGPVHGARPHFQQLFERLAAWSRTVRRLLADSSLDDQARERLFVEEGVQDLKRTVGEHEAAQYGRAGRLDYSWQGLARYWTRKGP